MHKLTFIQKFTKYLYLLKYPKMPSIILVFFLLSTLNFALGCYQSENIECSCTNTLISCGGIQREYNEIENILLNISSAYSLQDFLYLDWNIKNLTLESNFTFDELKLQNLTLSSDLDTLSHSLFLGLGSTLISLNLQYNSFNSIDNQPFSSLYILKELLLDFNNFHVINTDMFVNLSKLEFLSLSQNKLNTLSNDFLENLPQIHTLKLDNNIFSSVMDIKMKSDSLRKLLLQNCSMNGTLEKDSLHDIPNLEFLDLSFNQLLGMNSHALSNLKHLRILNLSHNSMEYLKDNALSSLHNLTSLDLKNNKLLLVAEKAFFNLVNLKYFDLSGNRLAVFLQKYTVDLYLLESINLENNKIKQVTTGTFSISKNLKEIFLKGNIFDCTCELSYFVGFLVNNSHINLNDSNDAICDSPPEMKGTTLIEMDIASMNCENLDIDFVIPTEDDDYDYYSDTVNSTETDEIKYSSNTMKTTEIPLTSSTGSVTTTKDLDSSTNVLSISTTESPLPSSTGSIPTTEDLDSSTNVLSISTTESPLPSSAGSIPTTEDLDSSTNVLSISTTESPLPSSAGSIPTTEDLDSSTNVLSISTTESPLPSSTGSIPTTEKLDTSTNILSISTTENLTTSTIDSITGSSNTSSMDHGSPTYEIPITLTDIPRESTTENQTTSTIGQSTSTTVLSVLTTENPLTSTIHGFPTTENHITSTLIPNKSTTESYSSTVDDSTSDSSSTIANNQYPKETSTILTSTENNATDSTSDVTSILYTTTNSNTHDYITTKEPTISTTEFLKITTESNPSEPGIQVLDRFILGKDFCVRWRVVKNLLHAKKCGILTQGLNGKSSKSHPCSTSEQGIQKCAPVLNMYKFCLNVYLPSKPTVQFCPEIPKHSTFSEKSTESTSSISSTLPSSEMSTTQYPSERSTISSVSEVSTTPTSEATSTLSSTILPISTKLNPTKSPTEFPITKTTVHKNTTLHFKLTSFDLILNSENVALATWTVNEKAPLSMCSLKLSLSSNGFNKTLGTFSCDNNSHKIYSIQEFKFFKVCLRIYHNLYATQQFCKTSFGLPDQMKAVKTKDAGYRNSSFIALTCLLIVVLLIIIVLVLKKVLKKRGESDRYNVKDQEQKIQRRVSHKRPESCVRYSYTVKEEEIHV